MKCKVVRINKYGNKLHVIFSISCPLKMPSSNSVLAYVSWGHMHLPSDFGLQGAGPDIPARCEISLNAILIADKLPCHSETSIPR